MKDKKRLKETRNLWKMDDLSPAQAKALNIGSLATLGWQHIDVSVENNVTANVIYIKLL